MNQLINLQDYTLYQHLIVIAGAALWVTSYLILIKEGFKNRFLEIPFLAICGNLAWKLLFVFLFYDSLNLGLLYHWGLRFWLLLDLLIVVMLFLYGEKQMQTEYLKKYFKFFIPAIIICYCVLLYFWIKMGFDNSSKNNVLEIGENVNTILTGSTSAFLFNLILSGFYLRLFLIKGDIYRFSFTNGVFRMMGTLLFSIFFFLTDPNNLFVTSLGIIIFICDLIYVRLVYKKNKKISLKINRPISFIKNDKFESKWLIHQKMETINDVPIRYLNDVDWNYKSNSFESKFYFYEGNLLLQNALGKMTDEDALVVLPMIKSILKQMDCESSTYYFISDSRGVNMAEPKARDMSMDFFQDNRYLKEFIIIVSPIVKSLIKMAPVKAAVERLITTKSKEEAFNFYFKSLLGEQKVIDKSRFDSSPKKDIHFTQKKNLNYLFKSLTLNQFHKIEEFKFDQKDRFSEIYDGLRVIAYDKQLLINQFSEFKSDAKSKLEDEHTLFTTLFNNSGLFSVILDEKLNILDYNDITKQLFRRLGVEMVAGYNLSNFLPIEQHSDFENRIKQLEEKERITFNHKQSYPDGSTGWYETSFFKLKSQDSFLIGVVSHDITLKIQLEKEKLNLLKDLQAKNEFLRSFHHTISHNLNHEIASIEQIVTHINDPIIDIRKKLELLEDLAMVTNELKNVKTKINNSLINDRNDQLPIKKVSKESSKIGKIKVVLIDDDPITNSVNKLTFKKLSKEIEVVTFKNGKTAITELLKMDIPPSAIFLDINMPIMNGWEFLEKFNEFALEKQIKIYVLTSSESKAEKDKSSKFKSVENFISKPLNIQKLKDIFN